MKLNEQVEKDLARRVYDDFLWAKDNRLSLETEWRKARRQYDCEWYESTQDLRPPMNRSRHRLAFYVPFTRKIIARLLAEATSYFFPPGGFRLGALRGATDSAADAIAASIMTTLLHQLLTIAHRSTLPLSIHYAMEGALVDGQGILRGNWVKVREPRSGRIVRRPVIEWLPNEHVCFDPLAVAPWQVRYVCHELWLDADQLWERQSRGVYRGVERVIKAGETRGEGSERNPYADSTREVAGPDGRYRKMYRLIEYWGPEALATTEQLRAADRAGRAVPNQDLIVTTFGPDIVLRVDRNVAAKWAPNDTPFARLPFWPMVTLPKIGSVCGHSMALWLRELQKEINLKANQRARAVEMEMTRKILYDASSGLDINRLTAARYGGAVPVSGDPRAAVLDLQFQTSTANIVQELADIERMGVEIGGVTPPHYGLGPTGGAGRTATGMSIIAAEGNIKQDSQLYWATATGIVPALEWIAAGIPHMLNDRDLWELLGTEQPPPPMETLMRPYHYEIETPGSIASKQNEIRNLEHALGMILQGAAAAPEVALPAAMQVMTKLLVKLGVGGAAQFYEELVGRIAQARSSQQPEGQPARFEAAATPHLRLPAPEETPGHLPLAPVG